MTSLRPLAHGAIAAILLLLVGSLAFAQDGPFVIKDVDFQVKGRTLSFVLLQKLKVDGPVVGRSFADRDGLGRIRRRSTADSARHPALHLGGHQLRFEP